MPRAGSEPSSWSTAEQKRQRLCGAVEVVRGLIKKRRMEEAFRLSERILDCDPDAEILEAIMCPVIADARELPPDLMYDLLTRLKAKPLPADLRPWQVLMRVNLLDQLTRTEEAFLATEELSDVPPRYGWMRILRGIMLTRTRFSYRAAEAEFRAVLRTTPRFWKTGAYIAEAALCLGERERAFRTMDELIAGLRGYEAEAALGWKGEMRLWCGEYGRALRDLTQSALGHAHLSRCWRGAALYKLGRPDEALRELDPYIERWPCDQEALIWRGEIKRTRGRLKEAAADLDAAVRLRNAPFWANVNRALAAAARRDFEAMWADYYVLPAQVTSFFQWKCGLSLEKDRDPQGVCRLLEAVLEAGKGLRRNDCYLYPVWMHRP